MEPRLCECGCGRETPLAKKTRSADGHVKGQPLRYVNGHNTRLSGVDYVVDPDSGCWIWQRAMGRNGYGKYSSTSIKSAAAHRVYYERHKGPIPEGLTLDHLCRNRACVNPDHLEPVTHTENCRRGSNTKLTDDEVEQIRELLAEGQQSGAAIGRRFGVSRHQVSLIKLGRSRVGA